ncbi:hypothetical protein B0H14DRAFT_2601664 [Mycena olivaceomarginata]|nr:hypothetical protein B0H14DRAFT_2601664 [Mycena olivaceomarginata]
MTVPIRWRPFCLAGGTRCIGSVDAFEEAFVEARGDKRLVAAPVCWHQCIAEIKITSSRVGSPQHWLAGRVGPDPDPTRLSHGSDDLRAAGQYQSINKTVEINQQGGFNYQLPWAEDDGLTKQCLTDPARDPSRIFGLRTKRRGTSPRTASTSLATVSQLKSELSRIQWCRSGTPFGYMSNTRELRERVTEGISRAAAMLKQMCRLLCGINLLQSRGSIVLRDGWQVVEESWDIGKVLGESAHRLLNSVFCARVTKEAKFWPNFDPDLAGRKVKILSELGIRPINRLSRVLGILAAMRVAHAKSVGLR